MVSFAKLCVVVAILEIIHHVICVGDPWKNVMSSVLQVIGSKLLRRSSTLFFLSKVRQDKINRVFQVFLVLFYVSYREY